MKKKLIFFITLLFILLTPVLVKADQINQIYEIEIQQIRIGSAWEQYSINREYEQYKTSAELYNNTDQHVVYEYTKIKSNKDYTMTVKVEAKEGYTFDPSMISLGNYKNSDHYVDEEIVSSTNTLYEIKIHYNTSKENIIESVGVYDYENIDVGQQVLPSTVQQDLYTLTATWYDENNTLLTSDNNFEAEKIYKCKVELTPIEDYVFSNYTGISFWPNSAYYQSEQSRSITENKIEIWLIYNTHQANNVIYGPIDIEVPEPEVGSEIFIPESNDERYDISGYCYLEENGTATAIDLSKHPVFESNKKYDYNIEIHPKNGYTLSSSYKINFTNLQPNKYVKDIENTRIIYNFIETPNYDKIIYSFNTNSPEAMIGEKANPLIAYDYSGNGLGFEIESQGWYNITDNKNMSENDIFEENKKYKFTVKFKTLDNYKFNEDIKLYAYGEFLVSENVDIKNKNEYQATFTYELIKKNNVIYGPDTFNTKAPVIGSRYTNNTNTFDKFTIKSQKWYNLTDNKEMKSTDVFERNKIYSYTINIVAKEGYHFSSMYKFDFPKFTTSDYIDKDGIIYQLYFGGSYGYLYDERISTTYFVLNSEFKNENNIAGYFPLENFLQKQSIGSNVKYSDYYEGFSNFLNIEQGYYDLSTGKLLSENDKFEEGKTYSYKIRISAVDGKNLLKDLIILDETSLKMRFGENVTVNKRISNNYIEYEVIYDMFEPVTRYTIIDELENVTINEPLPGEHPTYTISSTDEYTVEEKWYDTTDYYNEREMSADEVFGDNNHYRHVINVTTKNNNILFNKKIKLDGTDAYQIWSSTSYGDGNNFGYTSVEFRREYYTYDPRKSGYITIDSEYLVDSNNIRATKEDIDQIEIDVLESTGEYDVYSYEAKYLKFKVKNNKIIISNIQKARENGEQWVNIYINVDQNEVYEGYSRYLNIYINPEQQIGNETRHAVTLPTITNYSGKEDGLHHTIEVIGGEGGQIVYSLDDINYSPVLPTTDKLGVTKIYVKVIPDADHLALIPTYGTVTITEDLDVKEVRLNKSNLKLETGDSEKLIAQVIPTNAIEKDITWTVDDPTIASVDRNGKVKGLKEGTTTIRATSTNGKTATCELVVVKKLTKIAYTTHVQYVGWQNYVKNGEMAGTSGKALRLEGIKIKLEDQEYTGDILYRTHIQNIGWETNFKKNNQMSGTEGLAYRLEAIEIELDGEIAEYYDVYYRVHAENFGWLGWARNGESSGTAGYAYRLEGINIVLIPKGQTFSEYGQKEAFKDKYTVSSILLNKTNLILEAGDEENLVATILPASATNKKVTWTSSNPASVLVDKNGKITALSPGLSTITATTNNGKKATCQVKVTQSNPGVAYTTHVQYVGWQPYVKNGAMAGTSGKALRLEGLKIKLVNMPYSGDIEYTTHVQYIGWQPYVKNDEMAGTSGKALRLEATRIRLTGEVAQHYDVYYRVHAENFGWLGWARNGEDAGTAGYGFRLEGIEIKLIPKGQSFTEYGQKDAFKEK